MNNIKNLKKIHFSQIPTFLIKTPIYYSVDHNYLNIVYIALIIVMLF